MYSSNSTASQIFPINFVFALYFLFSIFFVAKNHKVVKHNLPLWSFSGTESSLSLYLISSHEIPTDSTIFRCAVTFHLRPVVVVVRSTLLVCNASSLLQPNNMYLSLSLPPLLFWITIVRVSEYFRVVSSESNYIKLIGWFNWNCK
jgi:hypothetical protein